MANPRVPQLVTTRNYRVPARLRPDARLRNVLWLHDWNGPSEALVPSLAWSPRDDLELSAGVQLFGGNQTSGEFGGLSTLWILRANVFF